MKLKNSVNVIIAALAIGSMAHADTINGTVNMDFVTIGNAGNAADGTHSPGVGAVAYEYRIGVTEVTVNQFSLSGVTPNNGPFFAGASNPMTGVSYHDAARYVNWLTSGSENSGAYTISGGLVTAIDRAAAVSTYGTTYVLSTADEWYKAAFYTGSTYSLYANGTATKPTTSESNYDQGVNTPWDVGSGLVEQNGTYDMMGNVWEWFESPTALRRGGANQDNQFTISASVPTSAKSDATIGYSNMGFRVVAIPEPGTISLMSISTIGLFITRRVRRRKQLGGTLLPVRRARSCDVLDASQEWYEYESDLEEGYLSQLGQAMIRQAATGWNWLRVHYKQLDVVIWNHMVAVHERKVIKRKAFRLAVKTKTLNAFDAFLASFMR